MNPQSLVSIIISILIELTLNRSLYMDNIILTREARYGWSHIFHLKNNCNVKGGKTTFAIQQGSDEVKEGPHQPSEQIKMYLAMSHYAFSLVYI